MTSTAHEAKFQFPSWRAFGRKTIEQQQRDSLISELQASHAREEALHSEKRHMAEQQAMLAMEFEHRLVNGLQLIASMLSLQSRAAATPEAAAQLTIASGRVASLGRVHHRLHLLDHQNVVEFKQYLQLLCEDLSDLLFQGRPDQAILCYGDTAEIPTVVAIPLGFVINELITNSAKYAKGDIIVRFEATSPDGCSLSVSDDGPGLPAQFDPAKSKGLGMKIVRSLVKQIGGELHIRAGEHGHGTRFTVTFRC
jgi:two-component system, sensor histidine kinase PdtaS